MEGSAVIFLYFLRVFGDAARLCVVDEHRGWSRRRGLVYKYARLPSGVLHQIETSLSEPKVGAPEAAVVSP